MTSTDRESVAAVRMAMLVSALGIAWQVAGRATRDALFLSWFDVTRLPRMVAAAAVISLVAAFAFSRLLTRYGPVRISPALYGGSAGILLAAWALLAVAPRPAAVLVFIHISGFGALMVSTFWSLINERFDPRSAKRQFAKIATAGTAGGVAGGLLAERVGALHAVGAMLPLLAALHVAAGLLVLRLRPSGPQADAPAPAAEPPAGGLRTLMASRYLLLLAVLGILLTVSEGSLDYVFKAAAKSAVGRGDTLLRVFALFYAAVNLLGIVLGVLLGRRSLERLGLARTVGLLPWSVAITGTAALAIPGLPSALFARLSEAVMRNSLYRSGSELLLTPLPPNEKRSVKPLLDVGTARIGDVAAAGLVQLALLLSVTHAQPLLLVIAVTAAAVSLFLTYRVHRGYVETLEHSLMARAILLQMGDVRDRTTRMTITTMTGEPPVDAEAPDDDADTAARDPVVRRLVELRARDPARVCAAIATGPLEASHVSQVIALLGRDDVAPDASDALTRVALRHTGQMVDALLDPGTDFVVRRRLPAVLARTPSPRTMEGLLSGLDDERFEVRFRCGRALAHLTAQAPDLTPDHARVHAVVLREVAVDRHVWESQQTQPEEGDDTLELDNVLRERASRSLEHVFTVLSLILPREPLRIAYRGLHTDDAQLRGTALEYLETSLPVAIREKLWPFLDAEAPRTRPARSREQIVSELIRSRASISISLQELRRRSEPREPREPRQP